ncbi:hypothetical protein OAF50_01110 [bacterium]|jgi:hypothetical protein|nr:hypothetical protein [bacterium]
MHVSLNKIEGAIEKRLTEAMSCEKPPIGPELAQHLAEWGKWLGDRGGSCRSDDWHVLFFRWALGGRAAEFKQWAEQKEIEPVEGALAAIQKVYEFNWPRNLAGYMFGELWGWLQVELKKPAIPKPLNVREQMESLEKHAKESGQRVKKWNFMGPCVTAVFEEVSEEDATVRQSKENELKQ